MTDRQTEVSNRWKLDLKVSSTGFHDYRSNNLLQFKFRNHDKMFISSNCFDLYVPTPLTLKETHRDGQPNTLQWASGLFSVPSEPQWKVGSEPVFGLWEGARIQIQKSNIDAENAQKCSRPEENRTQDLPMTTHCNRLQHYANLLSYKVEGNLAQQLNHSDFNSFKSRSSIVPTSNRQCFQLSTSSVL